MAKDFVNGYQITDLRNAHFVGARNFDSTLSFMRDLAKRFSWPLPHESDAHAFEHGKIRAITRISSNGWISYPEAIDHAFGGRVLYAQINKNMKAKERAFIVKKQVFGKVNEKMISTRSSSETT